MIEFSLGVLIGFGLGLALFRYLIGFWPWDFFTASSNDHDDDPRSA